MYACVPVVSVYRNIWGRESNAKAKKEDVKVKSVSCTSTSESGILPVIESWHENKFQNEKLRDK